MHLVKCAIGVIMKTLFIADDELNIREGLKCILDWEQLGYKICGEAANGEDALKEILKKNPSIVLLDIRMPKTYGTDVIKLSREQGFAGKFIILSGYSDFTYAQTAIKYGVDFYLTKPIDEDELLQAVNKITLALEAEKKSTENIELFKEKAKNVILHEIVTGTFEGNSTSILSDTDIADMNLDADIYQVVIYENFSTNLSETSYPFEDLLKVTNKGNHTFEHFKEDINEVILLKGQFALNKFEEFITHYEIQLPQKGSPLDTLFLAYGRPVKNLDEVYLSYEEALTLCKRRFFCMQGQHTLGYEELPAFSIIYKELSTENLLEFSNLLIDYLQTFNRKKVAATLYSLEEYLYNIKSDISSVKLFLTDLYLQIKERINHVYNTTDVPFPSNSEIIDYIKNCHYLYEIILYFSEQTELVIKATGNPTRDNILDDILYYIDHNYQNNIKLETIAPLFGYNSAYLGKIFNKATGESFNSYIDHRRIEHSKKLLLENKLKVYEVTEQVGYKNVDYFHKKFKKYVGISPAEYRKNIENEEP